MRIEQRPPSRVPSRARFSRTPDATSSRRPRADVGRRAATAALLCLAAGACGRPEVPPRAPATALAPVAEPEPAGRDLPDARAQPARMAAAYAELCARCHGPAGAGDGAMAPTLDPAPTNFTDADYGRLQEPAWYQRAIERGVDGSSMKRFDHVLDEDARWDMAFLVWGLSSPEAQREQGAERYAADCAGCHGPAGRALPAARLDAPELAATSIDGLGARIAEAHPELLDGASASERDELAAWLFTFLYAPAPPAVFEPLP